MKIPDLKFSPKATAAFGLWTTILLAVGAGAIALPLGIPHDWIDAIKSWCMFLGAINSAILTGGAAFSAAGTGPLAPPPTKAEAADIVNAALAANSNAKPPAASIPKP